ncbi:MAG TPA: divalent-cation tolerance protein CutA [Candidatus Angelobacter sp.]
MKVKARIVLTTAGSQEEAQKIGHALVERKLAACVNIVPGIESIYRWQGKVESAAEWLLVVKTTAEAFSSVRDAIQELHSYDLPECVMLEVGDGSEAYLGWIGENVE